MKRTLSGPLITNRTKIIASVDLSAAQPRAQMFQRFGRNIPEPSISEWVVLRTPYQDLRRAGRRFHQILNTKRDQFGASAERVIAKRNHCPVPLSCERLGARGDQPVAQILGQP